MGRRAEKVSWKWILPIVLFLSLMGAEGQSSEKSPPLPLSGGEDYFYSFITREEYRFYLSDVFPLSLSQKGRFYVSSFRGMPPGFLRAVYNGLPLVRPTLGFWNEQTTPHHRIRRDSLVTGLATAVYQNPGPLSLKPTSIITYYQDYITRLSYIDIDFTEYFRPGQYFQLAGNNFLRDGTEPGEYSKIQVNTYQGRLVLHLPWKWRADINFWQLRHRFNMPPEQVFQFREDWFKSISNLLWIDFSRSVFAGDSLRWTPRLRWFDDQYAQSGRDQRKFQLNAFGHSLDYEFPLAAGTVGVQLEGDIFQSSGKNYWRRHREWQQSGWLRIQQGHTRAEVAVAVGLFWHSEYDPRQQYAVNLTLRKPAFLRLQLSAFERPRPVPILWRTFQGDSFPSVPADRPIVESGQQVALGFQSKHMQARVEWFRVQARHYPVLRPGGRSWERETFWNHGVTLHWQWQFRRFWVRQQATFNANYRKTFAPRWNVISELGVQRSFFNDALKMKGVVTFHWLDEFRQVIFDRLLYQYRLSDAVAGRYPILDARLFARIQSATLYFVWENLLSTDYILITGTGEFYRLFRLGVRWTLFD
ncbi:MAG: hypothetical protein GXO78_07910 [Calditrichaeota bacterium]|nr:hypothetical protein [Calditrichota bacterium]